MNEGNRICGRLPDSDYVELAVEVFAMLADATRVRILLALKDAGEMSVNHLADVVDRSPAAVSQHLAKLRMARIVSTRNDGVRVFYRLSNDHVPQLVTDAIFQAEHALEGTPRHHHTADRPSQSRQSRQQTQDVGPGSLEATSSVATAQLAGAAEATS